MTSSGADGMPRDAYFLLRRNRINVNHQSRSVLGRPSRRGPGTPFGASCTSVSLLQQA
jgi:hypothetical protein